MLIVQKRKKFLTGHSYATGYGNSFHWSHDINEARRFCDTQMYLAVQQAKETGGKVLAVANTKQELRRKGKVLTMYPSQTHHKGPWGTLQDPVHIPT